MLVCYSKNIIIFWFSLLFAEMKLLLRNPLSFNDNVLYWRDDIKRNVKSCEKQEKYGFRQAFLL